ncbi:hypothetical protein BDV93DRAFT_611766 [Ceratobasidium sp. AG-I]|nr:hypothetical protein BDV93DRAFT_611766 [Ceratobasidium sp. AG-I]
MADICTGSATFTSFTASTQQTFSVSQSTSESLSIGEGTVLTRNIGTGTDAVVSETNIPGATVTVPVVIPVTVTDQQVVQVPVLTLFAPCTSESSSSSSSSVATPTSSATPVSSSTAAESTTTPQSRSSSESSTRGAGSSTPVASGSSNTRQNADSTPTPTNSASRNNNNPSETGTIIVTTSLALTTLPNGSQSSYIATVTTSVAPNGSLNNNDSGAAARSSRAVAIGVGVAGGVLALIILMIGITWQVRRKRRKLLGPGDDSDIWAPDREVKTPQGSPSSRTPGYGYSYNPYGEARTTSYAPVSVNSPPRARPLSLGGSDGGRTPRVSMGGNHPGGLVVAPPLPRTKTAEEILYEAARQDLPRSRATSATASHHTRGSELGMSTSTSHRPQASLTASHLSHGTYSSGNGRRTDSVVGLLEHSPTPGTNSFHLHEEDPMLHYHDMVDVVEEERPMSPVSVVAPRLAIVNPDDRDL